VTEGASIGARADSVVVPGDARASSRRTWAIIGVTLAVALVALAGITATRIFAPSTIETAAAGTLAPLPAPQPVISAPAVELPPPVENPLDSVRASSYAVVIVAANTSAGAEDNLRRVIDLPAATAAPSVDGGVLWYKVFVGAFNEHAQAEALRDSLRAAGRAGEIIEPIVRLPFAFLVSDAVTADSLAVMRERFTSQGVSTYALIQDDGAIRLYAGAFATPEEAMHLAPQLRTAGLQPRIVYRTGRPL
jgi:hypothetical protein